MLPDKANLSRPQDWLAPLHILVVGWTAMQPDRTSQRALVPFGPLALQTRTADAGARTAAGRRFGR
jgi:hypothetical protein